MNAVTRQHIGTSARLAAANHRILSVLPCALVVLVTQLSGCVSIDTTAVDQHRALMDTAYFEAGTMRYLDLGPRDGEVVLLVHGIPTSSWMFRDAAHDLACRGYRVIVPDLLGYGASDKPCDPDTYGIEVQAHRLFTLMDSLGIASWTHVCHNLGGFWTWEMIARHPERLERLVVLNTTAYEFGFHHNRARQIAILGGPLGNPILKKVADPRYGPSIVKFAMGNTGKRCTYDDQVLTGYWLPLCEGGTFTLRHFAQQLPCYIERFPRYREALQQCQIPAMLIWGTLDPVMDCRHLVPQFAQDLCIPPERIHLLPDSGHFVIEDHPCFISARIDEFIRCAAPK